MKLIALKKNSKNRMKLLLKLLIGLLCLILPGIALSQTGKPKPDCHDSAIVYSKLYEKTILIAKATQDEVYKRDIIISKQDNLIVRQTNRVDSLLVKNQELTTSNSNRGKVIRVLSTVSVAQLILLIILL